MTIISLFFVLLPSTDGLDYHIMIYSKKWNVRQQVIRSVGHVETRWSHKCNRSKPYDTGYLQVVPYDHHIRNFLRSNYGSWAADHPVKFLRTHRFAALEAGIFELHFWKTQYHKSLQLKKLFRKLQPELQNLLTKHRLEWIGFYNWGPRYFWTRSKHPGNYPDKVIDAL